MTQLTFDLPIEPRFGLEDFLRSQSNEAALDMILRWPDWAARVLLLVGPGGSGKTHLAHIWALRAHAERTAAATLAEADLPRLIAPGAVLIEDADRIGAAEAELFHLLNLAKEHDTFVLVTARSRPDHWGLRTADLLSRLRQAPAVELHEPDEALMRAVLVKLFDDRQLSVDTPVVDYVALRIARSLDAARAVIDALDKEALTRGRAITRPMAAEVLRRLDAAEAMHES
ncbi:DnaA ATPase domain-containing protein [Methylovirgula sp. 4M-Z18]|uniref:DnaA ATPase domain-containing protein n=1 Tax=Methylovirgula sp. 4M-Z18 TaxID=2293567 RepID=UPI0018F4A352|nr:DnaA/Hda family protein [Methylovirgula sp. 4M-Z18]